MKRLTIICLLAAMLLLLGCGAGQTAVNGKYRITLTNSSVDSFHGFGVEWYENGQMICAETAMKKDFLFVKTGEQLSCDMPVMVENIDKTKEYSVQIYIIGTEHAAYCTEEPIPVTPDVSPLELTVSGTESGGWVLK